MSNGLDMDNFLGSRPQDQMRALASMIGPPGMIEMYRRAADLLEAANTRVPDISLPPVTAANPMKDAQA